MSGTIYVLVSISLPVVSDLTTHLRLSPKEKKAQPYIPLIRSLTSCRFPSTPPLSTYHPPFLPSPPPQTLTWNAPVTRSTASCFLPSWKLFR